MKLGKNIFWGVIFLGAAAFILLGSLGYFGEVSGFTLSFSVLLIAWFVRSLVDLSWGGMLFSLAFGAILFDEVLGIEQMTPWPVLFAALFGTIGLNMIFKKKRKPYYNNHIYVENDGSYENGKNGGKGIVDVEVEEDEIFRCQVSFGSSVKYVNSKFLKLAHLENTFGNLMVYFDNAELGDNKVVAEVTNSFGKMTLYVPREWDTRLEVTKSFGNVCEIGKPTGESGKLFIVRGESSFGQLEVQYI